MKKIIWGILVFLTLMISCDAKDKYIIKIDIFSDNVALKKNLAFLNQDYDVSSYEVFEDGYYLFNKEDEQEFNKDKIYQLEIPKEMKDTKFSFVFEKGEEKFKTDGFECHFIKDENDDNVCYQEYNLNEGLIKDITNISIVGNVLVLMEHDLFEIVSLIVLLIVMAIIYNLTMKKIGLNKNLTNLDIFYIIFFIGIVAVSYAFYVVNFVNFYSSFVLLSIILAIYYLIYYLNKFIICRNCGGKVFVISLMTYLLTLGLSIFLYIVF